VVTLFQLAVAIARLLLGPAESLFKHSQLSKQSQLLTNSSHALTASSFRVVEISTQIATDKNLEVPRFTALLPSTMTLKSL
jgi:hypothetical protein